MPGLEFTIREIHEGNEYPTYLETTCDEPKGKKAYCMCGPDKNILFGESMFGKMNEEQKAIYLEFLRQFYAKAEK